MPGFNVPIADGFQGGCHDEHATQGSFRYEGPAHTIETARSHRFTLELFSPTEAAAIYSLQRDEEPFLELVLHKCTRPSPEIDEIVIHNGQDEIYRPGKNRWRPIEFTFYEVVKDSAGINDSASQLFRWWAQRCIWLTNSSTVSPASLATKAVLSQLDGGGVPIWQYHMLRCWPLKMTPSDLDYSSSDICETTVTMRFDKAYEYLSAG